MVLSERIRGYSFWTADLFVGGKVRTHYQDVKLLLENYDSTSACECRSTYLHKMLEHAVNTTPYYRTFKGFTSLNDFPVINKSIIKEQATSIISDTYSDASLRKVTTSGSTGVPLSVMQDDGKRERHNAENIYFSEQAGCPLGSRLYYMRVWNEINRKSWMKCFMQNLRMEEIGDLSDEKLTFFIERLSKDTSSKYILAFSSTAEALSLFVRNMDLPLPVKVNALITISEALPDGARAVLSEAFSCPVISRYSNMENGFLAQQCGDNSGEYHINTASYIFELLHPDEDKNVEPGETGRIVVTDLFNYAMPLIRYDTGDMAVISTKSTCGKPGPVFTKIEGRRVDFIYSTQGHLLSPHVITNTMWKYSQVIKQFQFIQNGPNDYLLKLNCNRSVFDKGNELLNDLRKYLCSDAKIVIELMDEIPLLASGKRKKILNNYIR